MAARFIVVVDEAKLVDTLGRFPLPLEVLPFAPGGRRGTGAGARRRDGDAPGRSAATTATC